jgi:hypothetical protein
MCIYLYRSIHFRNPYQGCITKIITTNLHVKYLVVNFISVLSRMENLHVIPSLCIEIALFEGTFLSFCLLNISLTKLVSTHRAYNCHGTILMNSNCSGAGLCMVRRPVFLHVCLFTKVSGTFVSFYRQTPVNNDKGL